MSNAHECSKERDPCDAFEHFEPMAMVYEYQEAGT